MYILDKVLHKVLYLRRTKMESKKKKVGPARPPSSLIRRRSPVVISASRAEASGACTKHVKGMRGHALRECSLPASRSGSVDVYKMVFGFEELGPLQ